ncbi:MAG: D-alanine--D-alanine ligase [Gammaproteobacteria bacterium]|nr:D-alanine--D-alanine ligase [Gammaproteobacteria bacterium]MDH3767396.1 D-alanine--D-alanine ligase [Gammaproteobacteria bacterium]
MNRVRDPAKFGKVAVLFGGESSEREISLLTGTAVLGALQEKGVSAIGIDTREMPVAALADAGFDRVWIALHGHGYEDGGVQGALQAVDLPYTGSGVLGSALAMDKPRSKMLFESVGLNTPAWTIAHTETALNDALDLIGLPCVVKPAADGSSVGVSRVDEESALVSAWRTAADVGSDVLVERLIDGREYTAGILNDVVLPLIRIETPRTFYDYKAKYFTDTTRYHCPCGLSPESESQCASQSKLAFDVIGASGWGRVDFMLDSDDTPYFLEVNSIPGMTSHSLVPMAAAQAGIDFENLVWQILETSFAPGELS